MQRPPVQTRFPRSVKAVLGQLAYYLNKKTILRPADRERDTALGEAVTDDLPTIAYDLGRENLILYKDTNPRWTPNVEGNAPLLRAVMREVGHLMIGAKKVDGPCTHSVFYNEQAATLAGSLILSALGTPPLMTAPDAVYPSQTGAEPFFSDTCVWAFTPSPLELYFRDSAGQIACRRDYLCEDGVLRLDLIAAKTVRLAPEIREHFGVQKLFGALACKLTHHPMFYAKAIHAFAPEADAQNTGLALQAGMFIDRWWDALQGARHQKGLPTLANTFAGQNVFFKSEAEARAHGAAIKRQIRENAEIFSDDLCARYLDAALTHSERTAPPPPVLYVRFPRRLGAPSEAGHVRQTKRPSLTCSL